jgi:Protein of unknown function (DUF4199)
VNHPAIRYGILGSVAVVFYFALFYFIDKKWLLHPGVQWGSLALYIACMYKAASDDCEVNGLNRDFRAILRVPFIVFLYINLAYWLFYYALHLADPALVQLELSEQLAYFRQQIQSGVGDPAQANRMREQISELEKAVANPTPQPLGPVLMQMAMGAIGGFALSAGITAIKRMNT